MDLITLLLLTLAAVVGLFLLVITLEQISLKRAKARWLRDEAEIYNHLHDARAAMNEYLNQGKG